MSRIELNHWFTKDNELSIALLRFYVSINIIQKDNDILFQTMIKDDGEKTVFIIFHSLEDAISFSEQVIPTCYNSDEVINKYNETINKPTDNQKLLSKKSKDGKKVDKN